MTDYAIAVIPCNHYYGIMETKIGLVYPSYFSATGTSTPIFSKHFILISS